jgi:hypothetical protein
VPVGVRSGTDALAVLLFPLHFIRLCLLVRCFASYNCFLTFCAYFGCLQGNYFQLVAAAFGLAMTSNSLAYILGAALSDVKEVTEMSSLLFVPQILYAGFFVRLNQIPVFLRWEQYLCGMSYAIKLVFTIEFNGNLKSCSSGAAHENCHALLASNDLDNNRIWVSVILLFVIFLVARLIAGQILTQKAKSFY